MARQPGALFRHQLDSISFFSSRERGFDTSDPGTGKTRVQIETFNARRRRGGGKALVLAPKSLLDSGWAADFRKFAPGLTVSVATAEKRDRAFATPADVYVTNIDAVRWLVRQAKSFWDGYDTLIIDEISYFKHHTSQRSKALNKLKRFFRYRYGLTGTPNANTITDIWHPVFVLDDGQRLGTSFFAFRASVCTPKQVGPQPNMVKWTDRPGAADAVAGLIKDLTIRHKFEECVDIPPNFLYTVEFLLSSAHRKTYAQMEEHAITVAQEQIITALNAAVVTTKLLQISSGAVYTGDGTYALIDTGRYELIGDLVEARPHSLVFFNWRHQRDELVKEFTNRGISHVIIDGDTSSRDRALAVELYQKGFYRVLLAHPQSASHGLTLTRGTSTIWASPTYNLEHFKQGNQRIYRLGQTQKTETIVVLAKDTIEEKVYQRLTEKDARQVDLLQLLRDFR